MRVFEVPIRREQVDNLALDEPANAQVFVIVNKYGPSLTANLQGPLVVNTGNRRGMQLVLADKRWTTRYEIVHVAEPMRAASA